ncbi:MAG: efflux RND transporter periplasmic adaptor subunit [Betaproteobacteria bacterium]|jgi:cobalt-zinc-cadmium efflux system membrane fusion protein|nr:efflux RND transporter periplasmic adaptor subunit [Betaproteobacteria bacterium]
MLNQKYLALLLVTIALASCTEQTETPKAPSSPVYQRGGLHYPEQHPQLKLLALSPVRQAQVEKIELPARLVWNEEKTQRVYSAFSGRVGIISVDLGQQVSTGQVLAKLSSPEFGAAQSEAQRAQADLSLARQTNERQQKLFEIGVIARKELDQSNAELKRNEAAFELAQNRIKIYENPSAINLELALRAALNGVVVERNINPSQELRPDLNQAPLFVISDPTSLWLQIDAQERDLASLSPGSAIDVKVSALGDRVYPARLSVVGEQIDPVTRSIKLRAIVSNLDRSLKSEMLAKAVYQKQSKGLLEVPSAAVFLRGKQHAVFVAVSSASFELREVDVAELGTDRTLIRTGLKEGEQVVTQNALLLLREIKFAEDSANVNPMKGKP